MRVSGIQSGNFPTSNFAPAPSSLPARWSAERADFYVDGALVRSCPSPPAYPMQLMVAVFDFPASSAEATPEFVIDYIRGYE
ncbi:hypothetical protein [Kribbella sp. NPDC051620]|uniref:hypothetical protein n=1 Tax=Kribbella sp. NPDC051620 TaxID=3364120 RepID=UPI00379913E9